jgi:hypothetical protein
MNGKRIPSPKARRYKKHTFLNSCDGFTGKTIPKFALQQKRKLEALRQNRTKRKTTENTARMVLGGPEQIKIG